jgi:two-component system sensor histidine kinase KdpD
MKRGYIKILLPYALAIVGTATLSTVMLALGNHFNPTTAALIFLLFVLFLAAVFSSKPALVASVLAMLCFNYFFLPPVGTFRVAEPQNWIALFVFLVVAVTAGQLSAKARQRAEEAERLYRELQTAFEKASQAEALKQSEKLKSALLDAVTHDLRTPLTSIKASITMLIEEHEQQQEKDSIHLTLETEGRGELLEVINEETDRLNDFVQSMVELARIEAGEFNLRKTRAEVEEIVSNAVQRAGSLTAKYWLKVNLAENLPPLSVDSKAIAEVIYNLLDNSAKYSPEDSTIEIAAERIGSKIRFSVEDEGIGIADTDREKVFQKFYRGDKSKKGFGMGLAIVRGIIEAHAGEIWIENGKKKGSRFIFDLPIEI